ncbi:MAG TPA: RagB/SusD family nutrient uptake outer membrane protein [Mucilaginibacter sp.]|jgi:hypothetical protein|nr:RagB/SusD family nutrient uptake outer membrane protein [Mucilaginibacter sp.]
MKTKYIMFVLLASLAIGLPSCKKDWLDAKPIQNLVIPSTLQDYQALLDNYNVFNYGVQPPWGETGADNYYLTYANWQSLFSIPDKNTYVWAKDIYQGSKGTDWQNSYQAVLYANVVLDGIKTINKSSNPATYSNIQGSALFYRSYNFYCLADLFAKPYNPTTASTDLGIPLRVSSDPTIKSIRSTVQQTYDQITNDLVKASTMLPIRPMFLLQPSKPAAFAMLARVYLTMGNYNKALLYADSCLAINNNLLDFNTLNASSSNPIPEFNTETIFWIALRRTANMVPSRLVIDSNLYKSYDQNDLRKSIFFGQVGNSLTFKGSYDGSQLMFSGLATDEIYLIRAECNARLGNTASSLDDLNTLMKNRWTAGDFTPFTATTSAQALQLVLTERRKELIFRGLRWADLRRLNMDPNYAISLERNLNGQIYSLPPNDPKYVYPIPDQEIQISGIQQNSR